MRGHIFKAVGTAIFLSLITVNQAFAWCLFGGIGTTCGTETSGGGGAAAVPEFDGPGAIAAIALLASIGALLFYRIKR